MSTGSCGKGSHMMNSLRNEEGEAIRLLYRNVFTYKLVTHEAMAVYKLSKFIQLLLPISKFK